jgi:hypothetical protein
MTLAEAQARVCSYERFLLKAIEAADRKEQRWWASRLLAAEGERARILCCRNEHPDRLRGVHRARAQHTQKTPEPWSWMTVGD